MNSAKNYDVIIVGAGVSGLALGQKIRALGKSVLLIEKSRSAGGRLATRRDEPAIYDHGAQFLKELPSDLKSQYSFLFQPESVKPWFKKENLQFYSTLRGMNHLGKRLSQNLEILFNQKVTELKIQDNTVFVQTDSHQIFQGGCVYLTAPVPQALTLLDQSRITYPDDLTKIQYAKALVLLAELEEGNLPSPYQQDINEKIFSISDQFSKGVSPVPAWTVTMTPAWSEKHFELPEVEIENRLKAEIQDLVGENKISFKKSQVKKWRYSHPLKNYHHSFIQLERAPQIYLLGDGFGGGSIRGALQSAQETFIASFPTSK